MAEVVKERRQPDRGPEAGLVPKVEVISPCQLLEHPGGDVQDPQAVGVAGVGRARKGQIGQAELLDHAESLVGRGVDQRDLLAGKLNGPVDRVPDPHVTLSGPLGRRVGDRCSAVILLRR